MKTDGDGVIFTYTGQAIAPMNPKEEDIYLEDIAHHLGNLCRYTGAVKRFYSVAEHSARCYDMALDEYTEDHTELAWILFHDAPEAYINDISRPLKKTEVYGAYREAEDKLMAVICKTLNLPVEPPPIVKHIDERILATEIRDLSTRPIEDYEDFIQELEPLDKVIFPWSPTEAKMQFLFRAADLGFEVPRKPSQFDLMKA